MGPPRAFLFAVLLTSLWPSAAGAQPVGPQCADSLPSLMRLEGWLHRTWRETSMTDNKPLVVSLVEEEGSLHLLFHKTTDGPWARGKARVCRRGAIVEAQLSSVRVGPAAPWLLQRSLGSDPVFVLTRQGPSELHIAATGWRGTFMAVP